jgi:hypothetical protein
MKDMIKMELREDIERIKVLMKQDKELNRNINMKQQQI